MSTHLKLKAKHPTATAPGESAACPCEPTAPKARRPFQLFAVEFFNKNGGAGKGGLGIAAKAWAQLPQDRVIRYKDASRQEFAKLQAWKATRTNTAVGGKSPDIEETHVAPQPPSDKSNGKSLIKFGRFTVVPDKRPLGAGSYGQTLEVEEDGSGIRRALKLFKDSHDANQEVLVYRKIQYARQRAGGGVNLLDLIDAAAVSPLAWLVMPLVSGGSLQDQLVTRVFRQEDIPTIVEQAWDGLSFLHTQAGLLHLDIKPSNLMWADRRLCIIDFSLVEPWPVPVGCQLQSCYCSEGFRSPELHFSQSGPHNDQEQRRKVVRPAVDWWSMGVVAFMLALRISPFRFAEDMTEYVTKRTAGKAVAQLEAVPSYLRDVLNIWWHPVPILRSDSVRKFN